MYDLLDDRWIQNKNQIKSTQRKVILTFDDGPSRQLEEILDILKSKKVSAMFFWQSRLLYSKRPWKRVIEEGHTIGAHTHCHKNLVRLTKEQQMVEIQRSVTQIQRITGEKVRAFRPPFGRYNEDTISILKEFGLLPVMWEISSYDWVNKKTPEKIVCNVVENIIDGSVILLHELEQTVKILPKLIDTVRDKGFDFTNLI